MQSPCSLLSRTLFLHSRPTIPAAAAAAAVTAAAATVFRFLSSLATRQHLYFHSLLHLRLSYIQPHAHIVYNKEAFR